MPSKDPFTGMPLSEQVTPPPVEQRLFTPTPTPAIAKPRIEHPKPPETRSAEPKSAPTERPSPSTESVPSFDLAEEPLYKATYVFTQDELEALEDLKLEFRRDLDIKVTKYDLVRASVHMLVEDHAQNKQSSYVSRKLLRR